MIRDCLIIVWEEGLELLSAVILSFWNSTFGVE
jgi:hypothetical protein